MLQVVLCLGAFTGPGDFFRFFFLGGGGQFPLPLHCNALYLSLPLYTKLSSSIGISCNILPANIVKVTFPDISCTFSFQLQKGCFSLPPPPTLPPLWRCFLIFSLNFLKGCFLSSCRAGGGGRANT